MTHAVGTRSPDRVRRILRLTGCVQGVGFRPFVYRHATALGLHGTVWNASDAVVIDVEGDASAVSALCQEIASAPPPRARLESLHAEPGTPTGRTGFAIRASPADPDARSRLVPDLAACPACRAELGDPHDRRFG